MKPWHCSVFLLLGALLLAACSPSPPITVRTASASPAEAGGASTVLLILENNSNRTAYLTAVESDVAAQAALLMSLSVDRGREDEEITQSLAELEMLPGTAFEMSPNGIFIQLSGLKRALHPGDTIELILHFKQGGQMKVSVPVR